MRDVGKWRSERFMNLELRNKLDAKTKTTHLQFYKYEKGKNV